jgi:hypothetical protein
MKHGLDFFHESLMSLCDTLSCLFDANRQQYGATANRRSTQASNRRRSTPATKQFGPTKRYRCGLCFHPNHNTLTCPSPGIIPVLIKLANYIAANSGPLLVEQLPQWVGYMIDWEKAAKDGWKKANTNGRGGGVGAVDNVEDGDGGVVGAVDNVEDGDGGVFGAVGNVEDGDGGVFGAVGNVEDDDGGVFGAVDNVEDGSDDGGGNKDNIEEDSDAGGGVE